MTPQGYDSRPRGNRRRRLSLRPDRKHRDRRIAGFLLYALFVAWVMWGVDQKAATEGFHRWQDSRPADISGDAHMSDARMGGRR